MSRSRSAPRDHPPPPPPPESAAEPGEPEHEGHRRSRERERDGHDRHDRERRGVSRDRFERRNQHDRRSGGYYGDRRGEGAWGRSRRSSRSPPRRYGGERRHHDRSRSRSRSPYERRRYVARERVEAPRAPGAPRGATAADGEKLFFDGFQWVKPTAGGPADRLTSSAAAPGSAQKDRRIHVGNLPLNVGLTAELLSQWICAQMTLHGLLTPGLEGPVVCSTWIAPEGTYSFLELRSAPEATNCLRLHGQAFLGQAVRVSRPNNYAPPPGQAAPAPLPLLGAQLPLSAAPPATPALGLAALAAIAPHVAALPGSEDAWQAAHAMAHARPERAIALRNFALPQELADAEERADIADTLREECLTFGRITDVAVPAAPPAAGALGAAGAAGAASAADAPRVYVQFEDIATAQAALARMQGRAFDGRVLSAEYVGDEEFARVLQAEGAGSAQGAEGGPSPAEGAPPAIGAGGADAAPGSAQVPSGAPEAEAEAAPPPPSS